MILLTLTFLFILFLSIMSLELCLIYNRNSRNSKVYYKRIVTKEGVKWMRTNDLKPTIKKYKGFYSFSHDYYNHLYTAQKSPSGVNHYISGDDILKLINSSAKGLKTIK